MPKKTSTEMNKLTTEELSTNIAYATEDVRGASVKLIAFRINQAINASGLNAIIELYKELEELEKKLPQSNSYEVESRNSVIKIQKEAIDESQNKLTPPIKSRKQAEEQLNKYKTKLEELENKEREAKKELLLLEAEKATRDAMKTSEKPVSNQPATDPQKDQTEQKESQSVNTTTQTPSNTPSKKMSIWHEAIGATLGLAAGLIILAAAPISAGVGYLLLAGTGIFGAGLGHWYRKYAQKQSTPQAQSDDKALPKARSVINGNEFTAGKTFLKGFEQTRVNNLPVEPKTNHESLKLDRAFRVS
jgi:hypothetical protein